MKVLGIILIVALFIAAILLFRIKILYEIRFNNLNFSAKVFLKTPFKKELYDSEKKRVKLTFEKLVELKKPVFAIFMRACHIIRHHLKFSTVDTKVKVALEDPMSNGITFGLVNGAGNTLTAIFRDSCGVKNVRHDVSADFNSGEGIIYETVGVFSVRTAFILYIILFDKKFFNEVVSILKILKKE